MDRFIDFLRAVPRSRAIVSHRSVRHNTGTVPIQIGLPVLQDREPGPAYTTYHLGGEFVGHYPPPPFRYFSISLSRIRYSCPDLPGSSMADMVPDDILRSTVRRCTPRALAASGTDRVLGIITAPQKVFRALRCKTILPHIPVNRNTYTFQKAGGYPLVQVQPIRSCMVHRLRPPYAHFCIESDGRDKFYMWQSVLFPD